MRKKILKFGDLVKTTEMVSCCDCQQATFYNKTLDKNIICIYFYEKYNETLIFYKNKILYCYKSYFIKAKN